MKSGRKVGPWAILAAGAVIQLLTGFPSAWGAFRQPVMEEYGIGGEQAAFAANCIVAAYGLGCVLGGFLQDKKGPKWAGLAGTVLLCGGLLAAGFVPQGSAGLFYLAFSLPVGMGCAFLYPAVMSCVQKWYQDKPGFATGVVGLGVGLSGLVLTLFVKWSQAQSGLRVGFWILAAILLPLCGGGSLLLKDPPQTQKAAPQGLSPKELFKTKEFWLCFASMGLAAPAVLLFGPSIQQIGTERGLSESVAVWLAAMGSAGSAAGRLLAPLSGDKIGKEKADMIVFSGLLLLSVLFAFAGGWWMAAVYILLCACYAGQMAVMPSLCSQKFGLAHTGVNYGFIALGSSVGSIGFPLLAKALGLEAGRHFLAAGAALVGLLCIWKLKKQAE